jgi:hypothetical protein
MDTTRSGTRNSAGLERRQDATQRLPLLGGRQDPRRFRGLADQRVAEVHAADVLGGAGNSIAMMQVHVGKAAIQHGQRLAGLRGALVEVLHEHATHGHGPVHGGDHVVALDPLRCSGNRSGAADVRVRHEAQPRASASG